MSATDPSAGAVGVAASRDRGARPVLVLGIGNELFRDEGLGVAAARRIAELDLDRVRVLDGGTLGLALLPVLTEHDSVLVLDAIVAADHRPGEVVVLRDADVRRGDGILISAHQLGFVDALAAAEFAGRQPRRLAAVGMVPVCLDTGYGLSAPVRAGLDRLVDTALRVLSGWGCRRHA